MTDTELLNWLEARHAEKRYTGWCIWRWSEMGRGWRLHETSSREDGSASPTVREAITRAIGRERAEAFKREPEPADFKARTRGSFEIE